MIKFLSFRHADLIPSFKKQRKKFSIRIVVYRDGNGEDSIDYCPIDSYGNHIDLVSLSPLHNDNMMKVIKDASRSWEVHYMPDGIDRNILDKRYMSATTDYNMASNTARDISTKIRNGVPYYFPGNQDSFTSHVNARGAVMTDIDLYLNKANTGDAVKFTQDGDSYSGKVTSMNGSGIYLINTPAGFAEISEEQIE